MSTSGTPVNPEAPDLAVVAPTALRSVHFTERAPNPEIAAEKSIRLIELDGTKLEGEAELMAAISSGFEFPDYFGANWDALEECLRDMGSWLEAKGYAIVMEKGEAFWRADADVAGKLVSSWTSAAEKWIGEGVPFNLVFVR
jgi:Barstar (barnase inhibitor)